MKVTSRIAIALLLSATGPLLSQVQSNGRIEDILSKMSMNEKIDYIGGTGFAVRAMPKYGVPALQMSDGPAGIRSNTGLPSTTYGAGITLAATWNTDLAHQEGSAIGRDARARGICFLLGPGVNIYRSPLNGRNFEYFGEDPFLASTIAVEYIEGVQQERVAATVKHFLGNNSEFDRHNTDSIIDERTLREIYLPVFEASIKNAHAGAIMDSYNLLNGEHMSENRYFNTDVLRKEWGFDGIVMSDWAATYNGVAAAHSGLDVEMPTGAKMNQNTLLPALGDGRIKPAAIDEKVRRILKVATRFGWLDQEQLDMKQSRYSPRNDQVALEVAREGIVLLKNSHSILPFRKELPRGILVVGPNAYPAVPIGGGSAESAPFAAVSLLQGIGRLVGTSGAIYYDPGLPSMADLARNTTLFLDPDKKSIGVFRESFSNEEPSGTPVSTNVVPNIDEKGATWEEVRRTIPYDPSMSFDAAVSLRLAPEPSSRRWTGYFDAPETGEYELAAQGAGEKNGHRIFLDGKLVVDDWKWSIAAQDRVLLQLNAGIHKVVVENHQSSAVGGHLRVGIAERKHIVSEYSKRIAKVVDAVVVAVGFNPESETEGSDRTFSLPFGQDELIRTMAALNRNTVVIVNSGGSYDTSTWLRQVHALVQAWYPGEQGGAALAEILFGQINPSGHLPISFERRLQDNPAMKFYYPEKGDNKVEYKEGIFSGYRGYQQTGIQPLFPFGYGLSYTTFSYKHIAIRRVPTPRPAPTYEVSFDVTNTGKRPGAAVAQVYVSETHSSIPRPVRELKGFQKLALAPGETKRVRFILSLRSFAFYDVSHSQWRAEKDTFLVEAGSSSEDVPLRTFLTLSQTFTSGP